MAIKIMLDAGHFAKRNQSPAVKAYWESEAMWDLQVRLQKELITYGFEVNTTRTKQTEDLPVFERGKAAKGCDLFLSLHSNAADSEKVDRVVVFYAFDDRNKAHVLAEQLADGIAKQMKVSTGKIATRESESYPGTEYYGVMRGARKVGVPLYYIVEHSFHTNPYAANWLLSSENRQSLAEREAAILASHYGYTKRQATVGDVNLDGEVDAADALLLRRYLLETASLSDEQQKNADVNRDGTVDMLDYLQLKKDLLSD